MENYVTKLEHEKLRLKVLNLTCRRLEQEFMSASKLNSIFKIIMWFGLVTFFLTVFLLDEFSIYQDNKFLVILHYVSYILMIGGAALSIKREKIADGLLEEMQRCRSSIFDCEEMINNMVQNKNEK